MERGDNESGGTLELEIQAEVKGTLRYTNIRLHLLCVILSAISFRHSL
jgi:hypothetical protein